MNITSKQAKQFNNVMKVKNNKFSVSVAKKTLEILTTDKKEKFSKNEYTNLKKYLDKNKEIVIKDFTSKSGKEMYLLKNGERQLLIEKINIDYAIINIQNEEIYPNFGYEALSF